MSLTQRRTPWMLAALSFALVVASVVLFAPAQIRSRPTDGFLVACAYLGAVALLAALYSHLHRTATFARTLPTFLVAAGIALAVATAGLQASFASLHEIDAPAAVALTFAWIAGSLAVAVGAAAQTILHGSFVRGLALTALAASAVALAMCSAPWLGIGR